MIEVKGEYKGYEIKWLAWTSDFAVLKDGNEEVRRNSVDECEKWIDKQLKKKFKQVSVYYFEWHGKWQEGKATSIVEGGEVWVVNKQTGRRCKVSIENVVIDSPVNKDYFILMREEQWVIKVAKARKGEIEASLERLTPEMMEP